MTTLANFAAHMVTVFLVLLLTACAVPPPPLGSDGQALTFVTPLSLDGVFAGSPDRALIAYGEGGLHLREVAAGTVHRLDAAGTVHRLDAAEPLAAAWRQDGAQLAAAFASANGSNGRLVVFDRDGRTLAEAELPGTPVAMAWSHHQELLVAGFTFRQFSFGGSLSQWLIRINGAEREQLTIGDSTLKPSTVQAVAGQLGRLLKVSFSPAGDELVVLQLHDPPQFPAYLQLTHRNWQVSTAERKLLQLPVAPVILDWGAAEDTLIYRTGDGLWRELALWPPPESTAPVTVPSSEFPSAWADSIHLQRFDNGDYLLATGGRLYAGSGLPVRHTANDAELGWTLRKWRFEGLISPEEYREVRP